MSTNKQNMVQYANVVQKSKGTSRTSNLQKAFPGSPIYTGELNDDERREFFQSLLDLEDIGGDDFQKSALGYYGMSSYDMNYSNNGTPDLNTVETGGEGKPGTSYIPNLNSPGETNGLANTQAPYTGPRGKVTDTGAPDPAGASTTWGSGKGIQNDPSITSGKIAAQTIGDYPSITAGLSTAYSETV